jgi:hypothetical protein
MTLWFKGYSNLTKKIDEADCDEELFGQYLTINILL